MKLYLSVLILSLYSVSLCNAYEIKESDLLSKKNSSSTSSSKKKKQNTDFSLIINGSINFVSYKGFQSKYYNKYSGEKFTEGLTIDGKPLTGANEPSSATGVNLYDGGLLGNYNDDVNYLTSSKIIIGGKRKINNDLSYGAMIEVSLGSDINRSVRVNNSYIFLNTQKGDFKFGSVLGVSEELGINVASITTIGNAFWPQLVNLEGYYQDAVYDEKNPVNNRRNIEPARNFHIYPKLYTSYVQSTFSGNRLSTGIYAPKISYISPDLNGFKLGISYAPKEYSKRLPLLENRKTTEYNNIFSYGVSYEDSLDNIKYKLSITGEAANHPENDKYHNIFGWSIGAQISYAGFKTVISHGNLSKSGIFKFHSNPDLSKSSEPYIRSNPGDSKFISAGTSYEIGPIGASVIYFYGVTSPRNINEKNIINSLSFGAHYHMGGKKYKFTPYLSWTYFATNEAIVLNKEFNNKGQIIVAGINSSF